jgi:hypothetical protein
MKACDLLPLLLLVLPVATSGACSSSSSGGGAPSSSSASFARFSLAANATTPPNFLDVPFPSDIYLDATGHVVAVPGVDALLTQGSKYLTNEMPQLDGFSRIALALFYVDDPTAALDMNGNIGSAILDPASLPTDETGCVDDSSAVFVIDLQATDPTKARMPCRAQFHTDASPKARPLLAVGPARGVPLVEGHKYAAVVTSRVKNIAGRALTASPDFATLRDGTAAGVYRQPIDTAKTLLASALATDKSEIIAIAPYTTNTSTKELLGLAAQLATASMPTLTWDATSMAPMGAVKFAAPVNGMLPAGYTASLDAWLGVVPASNKLPSGADDPSVDLPVRAHDHIAAFGTGVFNAINYLQQLPGGYPTLDDATFARDASGNIIPAPSTPTDKIWVSFAIPTGTMPATGWPVVYLQHGLSGSREFVLELANVFCASGWAVAGIDSVTFGARAPEPMWQVDQTTDYVNGPGVTYNGPDGISDADSTGDRNGSTDLFGTLENIGALRDQMRQAEFDTLQVVRLLQSPSLDMSALQIGTGTAPMLDATRFAYVGDSLGAIQGAVAAAMLPSIKTWVLNVGGGGLLDELAAHGPGIAADLSLAAFANFALDENSLDESHPMVNLIQLIADAGDPLNYASLLVRNPATINGTVVSPRNILQYEVIYDELVSNEADEALAREGGWGFATPNVGSNSGILDIKNIDDNPGRLPIPSVMPDAMGYFHDTPNQGGTDIIVQVSPGQHGSDFVSATGTRTFGIPYGNFASGTPFPLVTAFKVPCPYLQLQTTMTLFIGDAFAGNIPRANVLQAPVRDLDADGNPDSTDPDPANPNVH